MIGHLLCLTGQLLPLLIIFICVNPGALYNWRFDTRKTVILFFGILDDINMCALFELRADLDTLRAQVVTTTAIVVFNDEECCRHAQTLQNLLKDQL